MVLSNLHRDVRRGSLRVEAARAKKYVRLVDMLVAKQALRNDIQNGCKRGRLFFHWHGMVRVLVAQVFHVGCQVSKEDWTFDDERRTRSSAGGSRHSRSKGTGTLTNVAGTDFLSNLDVRAVDRAEEKTAVQAELHVGCARRLRTGSRDVLADVRGRYQHFSQGHGIVGKEEDAKVVLCVRVGVDHTSGVYDEANGLREGQ